MYIIKCIIALNLDDGGTHVYFAVNQRERLFEISLSNSHQQHQQTPRHTRAPYGICVRTLVDTMPTCLPFQQFESNIYIMKQVC